MRRSRFKVEQLPVVAGLLLLGIGVGIGWGGIEDEHYRHVALDLVKRGQVVTARDVDLHGTYRRYGGMQVDAVRVVVALGGREVTTELVGVVDVDDFDVNDGWQKPPPESFYAPPLEVLVAADDVALAMAMDDVGIYRDSTLAQSLAVSVPMVVAGAGLLIATWRWPRRHGRGRRT